MQYEVVILELLTRINKLENKVDELEIALNNLEMSNTNISNIEDEVSSETPQNQYTTMTEEMIDICYHYGKKVFDGDNVQELAWKISDETGMNKNSAVMYLYAVEAMLGGAVYKRAISGKAIKRYFDTIYNEYGQEGLQKAIQAVRLHVDYRRSCGHSVDSIDSICNDYESKINNNKGVLDVTIYEAVIQALSNLGGKASYSELYEEYEKVVGHSITKNQQAGIRKCIETHSSDSAAFEGKSDDFYSVLGIGNGVWGLRKNN